MTDIAALEDTDPTRRALRVALARCVWAMHYDATQGDGYCEEVLVALQEAAPLLGIAIGEREDRWGDTIYALSPPPADVLDALTIGRVR